MTVAQPTGCPVRSDRHLAPPAGANRHHPLQPAGYPGIFVAMVTVTFPWLHQLGCGCQFSRVQLTDGQNWRHWNPCGAHMVLAAQGFQPDRWPPDRIPDSEPIPVHS